MGKDEYRLENTCRFPNAVIRVYRPVLEEEEEEAERRMEKFKKATADFLMAVSREREQQACQQTENCV